MASEEPKAKQLLLRPNPKTYEALLKKAAAETVKRGQQISVQKLVLEMVEECLEQDRLKSSKATKGS
uniref:hypothetical protein n=1 Tax=Cupriavidus gilardii TaxID=82541 RepID=UPI002478A813|nr:hypothetical protein [Cupriavidus gilardii]WDE72702.1 hypothetical protein [Cupriavidus gilardii]